MNKSALIFITGVIAFFFMAFPFLGAEEETAGSFIIKGGTVFTCGPQGILKGASLLIENGKISKILLGSSLPDIPVKDYYGSVIIPGLVDAHSYVSGYCRILEKTDSITSDILTYPGFDPFHPEVMDALSQGITTLHFAPRSVNLVSGISSIFKLRQGTGPRHDLKKEAFLMISFSGEAISPDRGPTSLMGAEKMLMEGLQESGRAKENIFSQEGLRKLAENKIQPMIHASSYTEINTALHWHQAANKNLILVGAEEAGLLIDRVKASNIPVIHTPLLHSLPDKTIQNAVHLFQNGIHLAFGSFMPEGKSSDLRFSALMLAKNGIPQEEALKTITIFPAEILGVSDAVGSIEEGKDADLVILSGEPLDLRSKIIAVFRDGNLILSRERQ